MYAINKPVGFTPLEIINMVKKRYPSLSNEKITYAGRLDPLAHGLLLLLTGEEIKKRERYLKLPKKYEFEAVLDIQTDTYDLLGLVSKPEYKIPVNVNLIVNKFVNTHTGKFLQNYPPYSSKTVNGRPLFWWANNDKLKTIKIPNHPIEIYDFASLAFGEISTDILKNRTINSIASVLGDFRQKMIGERWNTFFIENQNRKFTTVKFSISCSAGTYVREIVNQLGKSLGTGATALDIYRTQIGDYSVNDALNL